MPVWLVVNIPFAPMKLLPFAVAGLATVVGGVSAAELTKVQKVQQLLASRGPSTSEGLNSTMSPYGMTRLFGNLNVKVTHTDAEGFPTTRLVRVPVDVTEKGSLNYDKGTLTKLKLSGLVMSRDAVRQQYGAFYKDKLSWGTKRKQDAHVDVVQGKDREGLYNHEILKEHGETPKFVPEPYRNDLKYVDTNVVHIGDTVTSVKESKEFVVTGVTEDRKLMREHGGPVAVADVEFEHRKGENKAKALLKEIKRAEQMKAKALDKHSSKATTTP